MSLSSRIQPPFTLSVYPGEHERSVRPGDDREPAAPAVHPGRSGGLSIFGLSGNLHIWTHWSYLDLSLNLY